MNSFCFQADSSCPVPRPAPELLEVVVKQREGNQNWRAKYIVATKVTRQDKFRQRPHHAVSSCLRTWLGEIHTLTVPDGSVRCQQDSDGDDDPLPTMQQQAAAAAAAGKKGGKEKNVVAATVKATALPTVSASVAGAAAAAVAAASAAAANDAAQAAAASSTGGSSSSSFDATSSPSHAQPAQPVPAIAASSASSPSQSHALPGLNPSMLPLLPNMPHINMNLPGLPSGMGMGGMPPMSMYPGSISQYMPLLNSVLSPAPHFNGNGGAGMSHNGSHNQPQGRTKITERADGKKIRLPVLPDLLICLRPIEEWGPARAPVLFVQTHGGQEYLLLKHGATYVLDVPPEHEVLSVRISMKNEKPRTLKLWKFEGSVQRPQIGQAMLDLEDVSKTIPEGLVVPIIFPPGQGDSPFHVLHIEKELHPTLPTVVMHQLHEPQHLHTDQTFFITPLAKAQRKIRKVLLPPPPSKPSSTKQHQIHAAAAGVISAIATGGNVVEASATLAATKAKKRGGPGVGLMGHRKKDPNDPISLLMQTMPGIIPGQLPTAAQLAAAHAAAHAQAQAMVEEGSEDEEPAGLDGLGRKRKRKLPPPSVAARLKSSHPVNIAAAAAAAASSMGLNLDELPHFGFDSMTAQYYALANASKKHAAMAGAAAAAAAEDHETDEEEVDLDEEEERAEQAGAAAAGLPAKSDEASLLLAVHFSGNGSGDGSGNHPRKKKKGRLHSDVAISPDARMSAFIASHDPKWLTKASHTIWAEIKQQPQFHYQAYSKEQASAIAAAASKAKEEAAANKEAQAEPKSPTSLAVGASSVVSVAPTSDSESLASSSSVPLLPVLTPGYLPLFATIQVDWAKLAKVIGEGGASPIPATDVSMLWKYVADHMQARKAVDLEELDLRSLWAKDGGGSKKARLHPGVGGALAGLSSMGGGVGGLGQAISAFPMFPMLGAGFPALPANFPGFPGLGAGLGGGAGGGGAGGSPGGPVLPGKVLTPAEMESQTQAMKAVMASAAAAAAAASQSGAGGVGGVGGGVGGSQVAQAFSSPFLSMLMNPASLSAAAAAAGALPSLPSLHQFAMDDDPARAAERKRQLLTNLEKLMALQGKASPYLAQLMGGAANMQQQQQQGGGGVMALPAGYPSFLQQAGAVAAAQKQQHQQQQQQQQQNMGD